MKLSKRLETIATFLPEGTYFADIGTDHAYLPCYVCLKDNSARAIAGEVSEGPFMRALQTVKEKGLEGKINVRMGNGLEVVANEPITELVIAGMGGSLIVDILEQGKNNLSFVQRIITQPNIGAKNVRKWLLDNNFILTDEKIIKENNHIYEILVADKGANFEHPYDEKQMEKQLLFGPFLLKEKSPIFTEKWAHQYEKTQEVIEQLGKANIKNENKINYLQLKLKWIEEVLRV